MISTHEINNFFGDMDLFLVDTILKGHIQPGTKVLDVGFDAGRNTIHFLQNDYEVHGIDVDPSKVELFTFMVNSLFHRNTGNFVHGDVRHLSFESEMFDLIVCSRVLHFMKDEIEFMRAWRSLTSCLKVDGVLYVSVNSSFGTHAQLEEGFLFCDQLLDEINDKKEYHHLELPRHVSFDRKTEETTLILKKIK